MKGTLTFIGFLPLQPNVFFNTNFPQSFCHQHRHRQHLHKHYQYRLHLPLTVVPENIYCSNLSNISPSSTPRVRLVNLSSRLPAPPISSASSNLYLPRHLRPPTLSGPTEILQPPVIIVVTCVASVICRASAAAVACPTRSTFAALRHFIPLNRRRALSRPLPSTKIVASLRSSTSTLSSNAHRTAHRVPPGQSLLYEALRDGFVAEVPTTRLVANV